MWLHSLITQPKTGSWYFAVFWLLLKVERRQAYAKVCSTDSTPSWVPSVLPFYEKVHIKWILDLLSAEV